MMIHYQKAEFLLACGLSQQLPTADSGELVFCGRSNVGKSSLINKLCNRKSLARVSGTPGKTTTINFFSLDAGIKLVDLPGYGYAKRSHREKERWAKLMQHYFTSGRDILLVLLLLDCRHKPSADDVVMLNFLQQTGLSFFVVLTKTDKLNKNEYKKQLNYFHEFLFNYGAKAVIPFSANGQDHAKKLQQSITDFLFHSCD
jgi:GTP-binding protein